MSRLKMSEVCPVRTPLAGLPPPHPFSVIKLLIFIDLQYGMLQSLLMIGLILRVLSGKDLRPNYERFACLISHCGALRSSGIPAQAGLG
jgi:hypothetical protein